MFFLVRVVGYRTGFVKIAVYLESPSNFYVFRDKQRFLAMKFLVPRSSRAFLAVSCLPLLTVAPGVLRAASGELDASFSPVPGITAQVTEVSGGKVLGLGDYTGGADGSGVTLVRYNADGSVDGSFTAPYREFSQNSRHFRVGPDGKLVVAGGIFNGQTSNQTLTRLQSNGALDPGFNLAAAASGGVDIRVQKDGKILSNAQAFVDASFHTMLTRVNLDGSVDRSFDTPDSLVSSVPTDFAAQPDGKVVMVGTFSDFSGAAFASFATVRFNADGTYDTGFRRAAAEDFSQALLTAVAIQGDGKLLVSGGKYDPAFQNTVSRLYRFNADGTRASGFEPVFTLDSSVSPGGATVRCVLAQRNGKIIVAGKFGAVNGVARTNIARLNADGSVDQTFGSPSQFANVIQAQVLDLAEQADGKLLVGGLLYSERVSPASSATVVYGLVRLLNDDSGSVQPPTGDKLPDLSAALGGVKLKTNKAGKPVIKATLTVANGGKKTAKGVTAAAYLSADNKFSVAEDTFLQAVDLAALGYGKLLKGASSEPLALKFKPSGGVDAGGKYLLLVVDPAGAVIESDEANNVAAAGPL